MAQFPEVDPDLDLPAVDRKVLELWREHKVFERSLEQRIGAEPFVFYEGPPTANGAPGVHRARHPLTPAAEGGRRRRGGGGRKSERGDGVAGGEGGGEGRD